MKKVFYGHAIDGLTQERVSEEEDIFARLVESLGGRVISQGTRTLVSHDDGKLRDATVERQLALVRESDLLFINMSIPDRNYIGCVHELAEAKASGITSVVFVGETGYEKRNNLLYLADHVFKSFEESMEFVRKFLSG